MNALRMILLVCAATAGSSFAASPIETHGFESLEIEARYKALLDEFRCPKCLNTNLSGSDAPIAQDLRATVYRLITQEQMSDAGIRDFLQVRYGDFVLYDPPFKPQTWLLWLGPGLMLALGGLMVFVTVSRRRGAQSTLTQVDQARLDDLLRR